MPTYATRKVMIPGSWGRRIAVLVTLTTVLAWSSAPALAQVNAADLSITKSDGTPTAVPGDSVNYTIVASNAGPSDVSGATVTDTFPSAMTATWTCVGAGGGTCSATGSGNINDTVTLPNGGSVTYTASVVISSSATGTLSNTATVTPPTGVTDPTPGNNSATDTDTLFPVADLAITKTDGVTTAVPGGSVTYTITASNAGPSDVRGATISDPIPAGVTAMSWVLVGSTGGGTVTGPSSGTNTLATTVDLPAGGTVTFTATAQISPSASGTLSDTATVTVPPGSIDPNPANDSATDTDTLGPPTPTPSPTPTLTPTSTATLTPTATATPTSTSTPTATATLTATPTSTGTPQPTPTSTSTPSPSPTARATATLITTATGTVRPTATPTLAPVPMSAGAPASAPSSGGGAPARLPPPTPTPTPPPDCGQSGMREDAAPPGYASDPDGAQGQNHPVFGAGLTTLAERDAFRASLPPGSNMAAVDDDIARGCSAAWIQSHPASGTPTAGP